MWASYPDVVEDLAVDIVEDSLTALPSDRVRARYRPPAPDVDDRGLKNGSPATHPIEGDELRLVRRLKRE